MVSVVVALSGPDLGARVVRPGHRVIGTTVGLVVALCILPLHPQGVVAVAIIAALQMGAELRVGRNYGLALLCITPLALMMGQLSLEMPVGPLLLDRFAETVLGAAIGVGALVPAVRVAVAQVIDIPPSTGSVWPVT